MKQCPTHNSTNFEARIKIQKPSCKYFAALLEAFLKFSPTQPVAFLCSKNSQKLPIFA